ncbi:MAG TPA: protein-L-isoaspartate(D-aspartate) O-methyltransferase [Bacteroidetes bacterium]|jgi:protein-L-isoaspartate(D-aspartate) O-methyltransferase|uniref:Protein-L-isoaspartate O-methyltransferase n=1 Tax=candidate division TA06 bacterium TaxID=2250710 RepID=A0A660S612_UNCT6|nr:MAG: protein-L-isoaspartate O-methyltransferase [candidate division TA06 bacterium]HHD82632.1 protein-L-isoaspartate(D-aspartate) O-methyltransferase [Bacteroidota bacterium]
MVKNQIVKRGITERNIINAFLHVPRHLFIAEAFSEKDAYGDYPLGIGYNQTISQPYIVALMIQSLEINKKDTVLEIGTGSGYQTAILAELCDKVFTVEYIPELNERARKVLNKNFNYTNIFMKVGDGKEGWREYSPFDKIIVSACADYIPEPLLKQLKVGGKMIIPKGTELYQKLLLVEKKGENSYNTKEITGCNFVKLV